MAARSPEEHQCYCGHGDRLHLRRKSRCTGTDSYGFACECVGFEHSDTCIDYDGVDQPEPRPDPDPHYRTLVEDNGRVDQEDPQ